MQIKYTSQLNYLNLYSIVLQGIRNNNHPGEYFIYYIYHGRRINAGISYATYSEGLPTLVIIEIHQDTIFINTTCGQLDGTGTSHFQQTIQNCQASVYKVLLFLILITICRRNQSLKDIHVFSTTSHADEPYCLTVPTILL